MKLEGSVAFVTGADRGLGERFVRALFDAGAAKFCAGARYRGKVAVPGAVPVAVDITDHDSVAAASRAAPDVTLLVNNAGSPRPPAPASSTAIWSRSGGSSRRTWWGRPR